MPPVQSMAIAILLICTSPLMPSQAQINPSLALTYVPPPPPDQGRPPGNQRGGASRGDCPTVTPTLTAIASESRDASVPPLVWGQTVSPHPTFWFYVPYALTPDRPGEFVLLDETNAEVYKTALTNVSASGVIGIPLPPTAPPLTLNKLYRWNFFIYCGVDPTIFVRGGIQRIEPTSSLTEVESRTLMDQADAYLANGIWYDGLTLLAELRQTHSGDEVISQSWTELLRSVDLEDVADQPLFALPVGRVEHSER